MPDEMIFLHMPNPFGGSRPWDLSTSYRNEHQNLKNSNVSGEKSAAGA
jgi:hypothetical protein